MKRRDFLLAGLLAPVLVPDIGAEKNVMCVEWKENPVRVQLANGRYRRAYQITPLKGTLPAFPGDHGQVLVRLASGYDVVHAFSMQHVIINHKTASEWAGTPLDPGFVYLRIHKSNLLRR